MTESTALAVLTAVEGAHAYSAFLPSIFTIRSFRDQNTTQRSIRDGELIGSLFAVSLGAIVAAVTRNPMPFYFAIGTAVMMVSVYEWALKS